jgi:hypothetical protein
MPYNDIWMDSGVENCCRIEAADSADDDLA